MPVNTPDQQLTMPVLADAADQSVSFSDYTTDVELRLVHYYVDAADRTARNPAPTNGQVSYLNAPGRWDVFQGGAAAWWEMRPLFVRKPTEVQVVNNSTAFVNDDALLVPMQINARYVLDGLLVYDSGTTGDIKFDWTGPAGFAVPRWTVTSIDTGTAALAGNFNAGQSAAAATALARGGAGIGTFVAATLWGQVTTAGTAGNLQLRWAQNALEAVNTRIKTDSWIRLLRVG